MAARPGVRAFIIALALAAGCTRSKAAPHTFAEAVADLEHAGGVQGRARSPRSAEPLDGIVLFETRPNVGTQIVESHRARMRPAGAYLFIYEHGFGIRGDLVGVAPTTDKFDLVRRARTDGVNYGHDNADVVAWLRELDREEPFDLTGAGADFVEGTFTNAVRDRKRAAQRIYSFCPDFFDQGIGLTDQGEPHAAIERYLAANRAFFFWWD